jgi:hypothetical protein
VLSEPANHEESVNQTNFLDGITSVGHHPFYAGPLTDEPRFDWFFGRHYPERLADFCQWNIETFYRQMALVQRKTNPTYFAEKCIISHVRGMQWLFWEVYPRAREIILVRDFRDALCSMLAFNSKRGYAAFGREESRSEEDFVWRLRRTLERLLESWKKRSSQAYLLRYEDLIREPVRTLMGIMAYLELDATKSEIEAMIRRAGSSTQSWLGLHGTSSNPESSIGRWQQELSPSLRAACGEAFSDILDSFGYAKER